MIITIEKNVINTYRVCTAHSTYRYLLQATIQIRRLRHSLGRCIGRGHTHRRLSADDRVKRISLEKPCQ